MVAPHNTLEKNPDGIGRGASPVRVIQHIVDGAGKAGSVSASTDVATLLTQDLSEDVAAVTINNVSGNVIFYRADGVDADNADFPIGAGQPHTAYGDKLRLDKIRLFADAASDVGILEHILL